MKTILDATALAALIAGGLAIWFVTPAHADEERRGAEYSRDTYAPPIPETPDYGRRDRALPQPPEPLDPALFAGPRTCYTSYGYGTSITTCY
jgi:hypothetical protein